MTQLYQCPALLAWTKRAALATVLGVAAVGTAHAQLAYLPGNAQNVTTPYADLGTTGTAVATANNDDANSAEQLIGFSFTFDGVAMDRFILNTNGFLKLGAAAGMAAPTVAQYTAFAQFNSGGTLLGTAANDEELLSPFNYDLADGSSPAEYRVATTGTAPNRVCTVQWKNVADKAQLSLAGGTSVANQYANLSFQVRMFETSNVIEFVYGSNTPAPTANNNFKYAQVGIKGAGSATNQVLRVTKGSVTPWGDAAVAFAAGPVTAGATGAFNFRQAVPPDNGRTYRFVPAVANDVAASAIQGFASVIVPANNPLTIRGVVRNAGTNALTTAIPVTLTISGANTYTATQNLSSLALAGSGLVTFSGIVLPNVGPNTVTLSVPGDGNNGNNSVSQPMETSATTFSLATPGLLALGTGFNPGVDRYYAAKMTLNTARSITAVSALVTDVGNQATAKTSIGESVYGVVIDATTGALLARSPNVVITAADVNTFRTFTLSVPTTVPAGDVLVGMVQTASTGPLPYFPFGVQTEDPTRLNTFYTGSPGSPPTDALTAAGQTVYKFPFGAVTAAPVSNDIVVNEIQGYGSVAVPAGNPVSLRAVVRNGGTAAMTAPLVVTLNMAGANTLTRTQTVPALAVGATAVVTFTGLTLTNAGANTVTVTVPNDDQNANNSAVQTLAASATRFSFIAPGGTTGGNGFGPTTTAVTRALCAKFTVNAPCDVTAVRAFIVNEPTLVTQSATVFGVVLNVTTGAVIARSRDYVLTTADLGQLTTFNLVGRVPAGDFLVGLAQVQQAGGPAFFPLGGQREVPSRSDLYYFANISNPAPPVTLVAGGGNGASSTRLMLEAETSIVLATSAALRRAVSVYPNPSATGVFNVEIRGASARQELGVEVVNMLGQRVYTGTAKDDFSTAVDLSGLAPGIYTLTLRNGQEYTQQKISIVR